MTLTEEQQEAIKYAISSLEQCGSEPEDPVVAKILRAMIDSSGTVEPTGGFDLEKARDAAKFDDAEALRMFPDSLAEIERMRAENADLSKAVIDISQERDLAQAEFRAYHKAWEQQTDRIKELEADLEQSERVIEARLDVIDQQAARIQELGGMLSIRTEELEIAHSCARSEREMHEKELVVFARKIAELEDALVEGLTNFLHYRASCYDPARRCPYAKECDDCSTWDACGHVEKFRSEARQQLRAAGKIGNSEHFTDASKMIWQITEERVGLLEYCLETLLDAPDIEEIPGPGHSIEVLRAMLREAE